MSSFSMNHESRKHYEQQIANYRRIIGDYTQYWIPMVSRSFNHKHFGVLQWPRDYQLAALVDTEDLDMACFYTHTDPNEYRKWLQLVPPYSFHRKELPEVSPYHDVYVTPDRKVWRLNTKGASKIGKVPKNRPPKHHKPAYRKPRNKLPRARRRLSLRKLTKVLLSRNDYEFRQAKIVFAKIALAVMFLLAAGIWKQHFGAF